MSECSASSIPNYLSSRIQPRLEKIFLVVGYTIWLKPCYFILAGILITFLCGLGFLRFRTESSIFYLWLPQTSEIFIQSETLSREFGNTPIWNSVNIIAKDGNILTPTNMDLMLSLYEGAYRVNATYNGQKVTYPSECLLTRPSSTTCQSDNDLMTFRVWRNNAALWNTSAKILADINTADQAFTTFASTFLGGVTRNANGTIASVSAVRFLLQLRSLKPDQTEDVAKQYEWQAAFVVHFKDEAAKHSSVDIFYQNERHFDDELQRTVLNEGPLIMAALLSMVTYLLLTLGERTCVGARTYLAITAMINMLCSVVIGFGLASGFGLAFNTLIALVPYILLGVGVDDMIIIVDSYAITPLLDQPDPKHSYVPESGEYNPQADRLGRALAHSGVSISLTSFSSVTAFLIGSVIDIPAVQAFGIYAAMAFLANYLIQFFIFTPFLVIDQWRLLSNRNFCCPCYVHEVDQSCFLLCGAPSMIGSNQGNVSVADRSGEIEEDLPFFSRLIVNSIGKLLTNWIARWVIVILAFIVFGLSAASLTRLDVTSDTTRLLPDGSPVTDWFDSTRDFFPGGSEEASLIYVNVDPSSSQVRANMNASLWAFNGARDVISNSQESWMTAFESHLNGTLSGLSSTQYYSALSSYIATGSTGDVYQKEMVFNDGNNPTQLSYTRTYMSFIRPAKQQDYWTLRQEWNPTIKEYFSDAFVFDRGMAFGYLPAIIPSLTVSTMAAAVGGVVLILIFLLDLRLVGLVLVTVLIVDTNLFGWMFINGIALEVLTFSILVMAVGLTVDYVIHVAHAFMHVKAKNIDERINKALADMGAPVAKGALTTMLGSIPVAFSSSIAFRSFFVMLAGIIVIAVIHGLVFLPAFAAIVYPCCLESGVHHEEETTPEKDSEHVEMVLDGQGGAPGTRVV